MIAKFITTSNSNYFIKISAFGKLHENSIDPNGIYYVITDTYSADYAPNNLTVVDVYSTDGCYARDLIADYIRADKYS